MIFELLKSLHGNPHKIKIRGKSLLYRVDLESMVMTSEEEMVFKTTGSIRMGPLSSPGEFLSRYSVLGTGFLLEETKIDFPKINFREFHKRENGQLYFFSRKEQKQLVAEGEIMSYDPQPLLFQMLKVVENGPQSYHGHLLLGKKQRPYHFQSSGSGLQLKLEGSELFNGTFGPPLRLRIPKLKVNLEMCWS